MGGSMMLKVDIREGLITPNVTVVGSTMIPKEGFWDVKMLAGVYMMPKVGIKGA
jgi:hypothetical protein